MAEATGRTRTAAGARATTAMRTSAAQREQIRKHALPDRLGAAWHCWRPARRAPMRCGAASSICMRTQQADGLWSDPELHRARLSARVLSEISRLLRLLPAVGARRLPHSDARAEPLIECGGRRRGARRRRRALWVPRARGGDGLASLGRRHAAGGERHGRARGRAAARSARRCRRHGADELRAWPGGLDPDA